MEPSGIARQQGAEIKQVVDLKIHGKRLEECGGGEKNMCKQAGTAGKCWKGATCDKSVSKIEKNSIGDKDTDVQHRRRSWRSGSGIIGGTVSLFDVWR